MLYERWREVASGRRNQTALRELASGRHWTFQQLFTAAESGPALDATIIFPQGDSSTFILDVLRGWRDGKVVCPLEKDQPAPHVALPPRSCIHLKSTSATTGVARLAAFTAAQLRADADHIVGTMGLRSDWPNLGVISMAHSYGFSNLVLPLLLHGIPLVIAGSPLPEIMIRAAAEEPALTLPAVPALWRTWHAAGAIPPNVRLAVCAGAPLPLSLERSVFESRRIKIHNFYGSTECGGIAYDTSDAPRTDETFAGSPLQGVELSVNAGGCLIVRSGAVGETYWPEPEDSLEAGRFQTSDLVELKSDGVHLLGRISDQINVAGRKVPPAIIEQAIIQHPSVSDCLVFGAVEPAAGRGELIVACVVVKSATTDRALRDYLSARLPAWQIPREWWFVESLEPNQRGKLSRAEWRRRYAEKLRAAKID